MSLWVPPGFEEFCWQKSSTDATRPAAAWGTTVTPGTSNAKGSYATVLSTSDVAHDVWGILIHVNSGNTSAAARDIAVDIGVDEAGGTSFTVKIPDLLCPMAAPTNTGIGHHYYFPLGIKAGSTIGARASVNNGTARTVRVRATVFGKPRYPGLTRRAAGVTAFGIGASSNGTSVTSGTTSDGTVTQLAASISRRHWWWQLGMGQNDSTSTNGLQYYGELHVGDGTNNVIVIRDQAWHISSTGEQMGSHGHMIGCVYDAPAGLNVYGRLQCSGTADASLSLAGYGCFGFV